MRAERLKGMAVVDVDAAVKLGTVSDVILDPGARQVAGLIVARGQSLLGGGQHFTLPASAVRALGQDAVTVRRAEAEEQVGHLGGLPRLGQVVGRKVVTENGRLVGTIEDVEIDPLSGAIVAYPVGGRGPGGALAGLLGAEQGAGEAPGAYIRADADLRVGPELIVVPDDALVQAGDRPGEAPSLLDPPAADRPAPVPPSPARTAPAASGGGWTDPLPRAGGAPAWVEPVRAAPVEAPAEDLEPTQVIVVEPGPDRRPDRR